jgi:hypothetical protein
MEVPQSNMPPKQVQIMAPCAMEAGSYTTYCRLPFLHEIRHYHYFIAAAERMARFDLVLLVT